MTFEWISVEKPPIYVGSVLVNCTEYGVTLGCYEREDNSWETDDGEGNWEKITVTHWAHLPEPPNGEK